jgi:hypothetical protein
MIHGRRQAGDERTYAKTGLHPSPRALHRHVVSRSECWAVTVARCPFCGRKHYHGGGAEPEPDLGWRLAHCDTPDSYQLAESAASITARRANPRPTLPNGCLGCWVVIDVGIDRCSGCEVWR